MIKSHLKKKKINQIPASSFLKESWYYYIILILLIEGIAFVGYQNSFSVPWHFDDWHNILQNPKIRILTFSFGPWIELISHSYKESIRFFAFITFALNYYFGGFEVWGYHLVNLVIHGVTGILVFWFVWLTFHLPSQRERYGALGLRVAFFSALIFVSHPVQTQAVTYIVQRMSSMAAMFYLFSLICYVKARLSGTIRRIYWYGGMAGSGLLAIFTKENALMLPLFILLYEVLFFQGLEWKVLRKRLGMILGVLGILGLVGIILWGGRYWEVIREGYLYRDFTMGERVLTQFRVVFYYLTLLIYPHPSRLNLDYDFPVSRSLVDPVTTFFSLLAILFVLGVGAWRVRRNSLLSFWIFWYFGNLLIESSVIPLEMVYEHRIYLPSIGPIVLFVWGLVRVWDGWLRRFSGSRAWNFVFGGKLAGWLVVLPMVLLLSWGTMERNKVWGSRLELWKDCVKKSPNKARPHNNLGVAYKNMDLFSEAIPEFRKALELNPHYIEAYRNLNFAYMKKGSVDEAIQGFQKLLTLNPKDVESRANLGEAYVRKGLLNEATSESQRTLELDPENLNACKNLAMVYSKKGMLDEAIKTFRKVLEIDPFDAEALNNLSSVYIKDGMYDEAITQDRKILSLDPQNIEALLRIGESYARKGMIENAISETKKALLINNRHATGHAQLSALYLQQGMLEEAFKEAEATLALEPKDTVARNNLGVIYRHKGMLDNAISMFKEILTLDPNHIEARVNLAESYGQKGMLSEALHEVKKALQLDPNNLDARLNLGAIYVRQGKLDEGIWEWKGILKNFPNDPRVHNNLAVAYYYKKDFKEAVQHYRKASESGHSIDPQLTKWLKPYL